MLAGEVLGDAYVDVQMEMGKLNAQFAQLSRLMGIAGGTAGRVFGVALGAAVVTGFAVAVAGLRKYAEQEVLDERLAGAIRLAGESANEAMPKIAKFTDELQRTTMYTDDQIKSAIRSALAMGMQADNIEEVTKAAIGLSERAGVGLPRAMKLLINAQQGGVGAFKKWGVDFDGASTKTEKFTRVLQWSLKGLEAAERLSANTLKGQFDQIHKSFNQVLQTFG